MDGDLRTRLTKQIVINRFIDLLETTPLNKITVSAICASAEINRATFYRYYENPRHLYESIEDWFFNEIKELTLETIDSRTGQDSFKVEIEKILRFYKENQKIVLAMKSKNGDYDFEFRMLRNTFDFMSESLPLLNGGLSESENRRLFQYMGYGSAAVVYCWLENDMKENIEDVADFIHICSQGIHLALQKKNPSFSLEPHSLNS